MMCISVSLLSTSKETEPLKGLKSKPKNVLGLINELTSLPTSIGGLPAERVTQKR